MKIDFFSSEGHYPGDLKPSRVSLKKTLVIVEDIEISYSPIMPYFSDRNLSGMTGDKTISDKFNKYLPWGYQANDISDVKTIIWVKNILEPIGLYTGAGVANRTHRYIFIIDKKTARVIARKYIIQNPPESFSQDKNGVTEDNYSKETKELNRKQLKEENQFFQSLIK